VSVAVATEFDRHAHDYEQQIADALAFAGQPHERYLQAKVERLLHLARRRLGDRPIGALDVGCGTGLVDSRVRPHVRSLAGVDVSAEMVERASATNPDVHYHVSDGASLPHEDGSFDLTFAICVLHHVDPDERAQLVHEMKRVTRPGGLVAVFEHNPLNPLTRRVVKSIAFDEGVQLLGRGEVERAFRHAALDVTDAEYLLFTPWRRLDRLERAVTWLPLGAQYVVAARA
jgi:SAM-dependent methyltransferase